MGKLRIFVASLAIFIGTWFIPNIPAHAQQVHAVTSGRQCSRNIPARFTMCAQVVGTGLTVDFVAIWIYNYVPYSRVFRLEVTEFSNYYHWRGYLLVGAQRIVLTYKVIDACLYPGVMYVTAWTGSHPTSLRFGIHG